MPPVYHLGMVVRHRATLVFKSCYSYSKYVRTVCCTYSYPTEEDYSDRSLLRHIFRVFVVWSMLVLG